MLAGCVTERAPHQIWYQPGRTPEQTFKDYAECKREAAKAADPLGLVPALGGGGGWSPAAQRTAQRDKREREFLDAEMRARGYVPTLPPAGVAADQYPAR